MRSCFWFVALLVVAFAMTLSAPAFAQESPPPDDVTTDPHPPPDDEDGPTVVLPPPDREMPSDKPIFVDPHLGAALVAFDDEISLNASTGIDIHFRMLRHVALALTTRIGGGGLLSGPDEGGSDVYHYGFGIAAAFRANLDRIRFMLGVEFAGLRTTNDVPLMHGALVHLRVESNVTEQLMVRLAGLVGPAWDEDEEIGVGWGVTLGAAYSF